MPPCADGERSHEADNDDRHDHDLANALATGGIPAARLEGAGLVR